MLKKILVVVSFLACVPLSACGTGDDDPASVSTVTVTVTPSPETVTEFVPEPAQSDEPITAVPPAPEPTDPPSVAPVMPDVMCMNLQDAQNAIQRAGVFYSRSEDATGQGRMQVLDRNWVVVEQHPAPGEVIGEGDALLSAVKEGEPGDCS